MLQKFSFIFSSILFTFIFALSGLAQANIEGTVSVKNSKLAAINLPFGARRINDSSVPQEIKDTLAKIIKSGGDQVRQGDSEVVVWGGNYAKTNGTQMIKNLETSLTSSGWECTIGAKDSDFVLFSIFRAAPQRRLVMGFFVPTEDAFVLALTEMVRADAPISTVAGKENAGNVQNFNRNDSGDLSLMGKWYRSTGSGQVDSTGKTQYKAYDNYYFEFFPNGIVEYTHEKDLLTILQCKIKGSEKARGQFTISGDTMTINLGEMSSVGTDSCDAKGNFTKTEPASTITKKFQIRKMDTLFRPDKPTILCFDGQADDDCFRRSN